MKNRFPLYFIFSATVLAGIFHFLPHPANFNAFAALALFSGSLFYSKKAWGLLPLGGLLLTDLITELIIPGAGLYPELGFVYASFLLIFIIGIFVRRTTKPAFIAAASIGGSILFFLITNYADWLLRNHYPHTAAGLLTCYEAGLPFLKNTLIGDLFFNAVFFGGWYAIARRFGYAGKAA